jgi:hypothetical protein
MGDRSHGVVRRLLPAGLAATFFAFMTVLYLTDTRALYDDMLRSWGVDPYRVPFVDVETVLSAIRCMHEGIDVFKSNPCDPVRRVFDYSPLWLLLAYFPVTEAWTMPTGFIGVLSFIASLVLLPAGRSRLAVLLISLAAISPAVVFGAERGNNDLVLFVLAAVAASALCRTPGLRLLGYGAALLAGLLKYYPMTLLMMATREKPARFFAVATACTLLLAVFILTMGHELTRALQLIPGGGWFGDMFGAKMLGGGLGRQYWISPEAQTAVRISMTVIAFAAGLALAFRQSMTATLERLTDLERMSLLAGGLLILSCFFTAQNIGYRAMHLVLVIPALTALAHTGAGWIWTVTLWSSVLLLWAQGWRNWFFSTDAGRQMVFVGWSAREILWWWTITMLIAVVAGLLIRSEMGRRVFSGARRQMPLL